MKIMPRVIVLNGNSGSGKSSLAKAFQELQLPDNIWLSFSIDTILDCLPPSVVERVNNHHDASALDWPKLSGGAHACVREMVMAGNRVIFDRVFAGPGGVKDLLPQLKGLDPVLVGLDCPLDELRRRTLKRGDRTLAECEENFGNILPHLDYDLIVDTGKLSPQEAALEVIDGLRALPEATGWVKTMARYGLS